MKYKYLGDIAIADIAFEAYGNNLNELFENCALALSEVMVNLKTVKHKRKKQIKIKEKKTDLLLFDFLNEIIFLKDSDSLLFNKFKVNIKDNKLTCTAEGEKIDRENHELKLDVKAVTMHMLEVKEEKSKWKATVVLDI